MKALSGKIIWNNLHFILWSLKLLQMGFQFDSWILKIALEKGKRKQWMDAIKWIETHYSISNSIGELWGCARLNCNYTQICQIVCFNTRICLQPGMSYYKG